MDMAGRSFTFVEWGWLSAVRAPRTAGRDAAGLGDLRPLLHVRERQSRRCSHLARAVACGHRGLEVRFRRDRDRRWTGEPVNFASDVEDLRAAAKAMAAAGMSPSLLVGHSLGGTAAIVAAADMPDIAAVATIGAPADLQHILRALRTE